MTLTKQQIEDNKNRFLALISSITIDGADINGLCDYLLKSDFFTAPASTMYHCAFEGGLCFHSLNVYDTLVELAEKYQPNRYSLDTLKAVALLHDAAKINFYESYTMNKKIYSEKGTKSDNHGKFDWFAEDAYKVKDAKDRFLSGEHGLNSFMIVSQFLPLTLEEGTAIINHHCSMGEANPLKDLSAVLTRYPLATLLHTADFLSTFIKENF